MTEVKNTPDAVDCHFSTHCFLLDLYTNPPYPHSMRTQSFFSFFLLLVSCMLLASCLVPNKYTAHIKLTPTMYSIEFIGEMHMMLPYSDRMKKENLDPKVIPKQIMQEFKRVIKERNQAQIELRPSGEHIFQTAFSYNSPYTYPEASGLFTIEKKGKIVTLTSRHINAEERGLMHKHRIESKGTLTIKVYGDVIESNAHIPASAFKQYHTWHMQNLDEGIKIVVRLP